MAFTEFHLPHFLVCNTMKFTCRLVLVVTRAIKNRETGNAFQIVANWQLRQTCWRNKVSKVFKSLEQFSANN